MALEKVVGKITGLGARGKQIMKSTAKDWKAGSDMMSRDERDMYWMGVGLTGAGTAYELTKSDK